MIVEFSGGLETEFGAKKLNIDIADGSTIGDVLRQLCSKLGDDAVLVCQGSVRPGVLVLVNDVDWELLGLESYKLQAGDVLHFASTLHGG